MLKCLMSTTETKMSKKNSVKFQQILAWLMTEVMFGKAHSDGVIARHWQPSAQHQDSLT
jgi:hypothetical protein